MQGIFKEFAKGVNSGHNFFGRTFKYYEPFIGNVYHDINFGASTSGSYSYVFGQYGNLPLSSGFSIADYSAAKLFIGNITYHVHLLSKSGTYFLKLWLRYPYSDANTSTPKLWYNITDAFNSKAIDNPLVINFEDIITFGHEIEAQTQAASDLQASVNVGYSGVVLF